MVKKAIRLGRIIVEWGLMEQYRVTALMDIRIATTDTPCLECLFALHAH